ncbi:MAG: cupin domain-containing protein [Desulfobacterales bacterium]|nr:cupin domain-containing protein [Desulfobacterales bacterium]
MSSGIRQNVGELAIGEKIRQMRLSKSLSLEELAEKTGLSKGLLSQIEREQISPPISTLLKVAASLGTDISFFFQEETENPRICLVRSNERLVSRRRQVEGKANLGYSYEALAYKKAFKYMEPFLVTFSPKEAEDVIRFSHEGEEFAFLLEGTLEFTTDRERIVLEPGDSLYFDSNQLHGFRALGDAPARALVTVCHK